MEALLFLSHRIPYPPNKGDKIRSFNMLKFLSQSYEIHLGTFIDDPNDFQYQGHLDTFTASKNCIPLSRSTAAQTKGAISALCQNKPITLPCFYNKPMQQWVNKTVKQHNIKHAFIFCSSMAQYLEGEQHTTLNRVIDFVDIDSDKWKQYAESKPFPISTIYQREHQLLAKYEAKITQSFDHSTFVSPDEATMYQSLIPKENRHKVLSVLNGVDTEFFNHQLTTETAEINLDNLNYIVFTGAMDYWANEEAVIWFIKEVWPMIINQAPDLHFLVVGGNPPQALIDLQKSVKNLTVTGRVQDIRPYINQAKLAVAPLRIARGIQNKVLEAMALHKTVVMTSMAAEGINLPSEQQSYVLDDAKETANSIIELIDSPDLTDQIGNINQQWIIDNYQWDAVLKPLKALF